MGIQGLLPLLKSIMEPIHIKDLVQEGCSFSVAVDTYSWLHKGALSCSKELCKGLPTKKHIDYCMHRVNLLRHYGIKPVLVFDGGFLPMKSEQENKRGRSRKENLARAIEHESNGNNSGAYECYQKAVDVSPLMAYELIQVLKKENVCYIVAPYEADAQMTFLSISKQVDAVITEDSDLIAFGCPRIIYKMDKFGQGVEFQYAKLQKNKDLNFSGFTQQMVLEMCILSGCDYLQSLPGLGLKKAHALVKKFRSYDKVIKHLRYSTVAVTPGYEEAFEKAILTFRHQRVYDPAIEDIVHLSSPSENIGNSLDFLGPYIPQHLAKGIAVGDVDPLTMLPFQDTAWNLTVKDGLMDQPRILVELKGLEKCADLAVDNSGSYELKHFKTEPKKLELPAQKNLLTNYFCSASLEAKRKYRTPRTAEEATLCCTDSPLTSPPETENLNISSPKDYVAKGAAEISHNLRKVDNLDDMTSVQDPYLPKVLPIYKPCVRLNKQRVQEPASYIDESKMRTEHTKVIVRSRYFQHKPARVSDMDKQNEKLSGKDDVNMGEAKIAILSREDKIASDEENALLKKRKTTIRSSYIRHKPVVNEYDQDIRNEENRSKEGPFVHDSPILDNVEMMMDQDNVGTEASNPIQKTKDDTEGGKFGSNISHLETYSDIAEKSMERFVSVISSFKCSPGSGSRASGLRAPLKDVRNTYTPRPAADVDFSKFAYVPKKGKALPSYRNRRR